MLAFIAAVIAGLALLTWSSDKFVDGAANVARLTGISPLVIGIVVIGFGTSAPEMLVSVTAALDGSPGISLGNAIGSNITNIALMLGITALLIALPVKSSIVRRELPMLLLAGVVSYVLLMDGHANRLDGIILMVLLFTLLGWLVYKAMNDKGEEPLLDDEEMPDEMPLKPAILWTVAGLVLLVLSSKILVWGAVGIAEELGVSDLIIGLTIIALGTSLPELAASIASVRKNQSDMAVGNIVGSNLFNNLAVIGLAALIHPLATPDEVLSRDLPMMLGLTFMIVVFAFTPPRNNVITRWEAIVFLSCFFAYQYLLYLDAVGA